MKYGAGRLLIHDCGMVACQICLMVFKCRMAKRALTTPKGVIHNVRAGMDARNQGNAGPHHGECLAHVNGHDVVACHPCGFRHVLPLPDPAAMEREYRENYYVEEKPDFLSRVAADQDWAILAQSDRLEIFERLLPPA